MKKPIGEFPTTRTEKDIEGEGSPSQLIEALLKLGREYQAATEIQIVDEDKSANPRLLSGTHGLLQHLDTENKVIFMHPRFRTEEGGNFVEDANPPIHKISSDTHINWVIHPPTTTTKISFEHTP